MTRGFTFILRFREIAKSPLKVINGKLVIDKTSTIQANYTDDIIEVLKKSDDVKSKFMSIRQIIADSKIKDFTPLYRSLYDNVDNYGGGKVGQTILNIADGQYKDSMVVDKEINVMAMILNILMTIG